jgi:signal transduction histidine kinase/ActR/RegA family two-component response regulator
MITSQSDLEDTTATLRARLAEAEDMLRAIRQGEIDALVVQGTCGDRVYTLHSADEPYRNLVEEMQEGAVVLTGHGEILYANARFAALVGEPLESVVASRIDRFVNPSEWSDFETMLASGGGRRRSRFIGAGANAFEVGLSLTTTVSSNGRRLNLIVTDLTEILQANRNRDRAEHDSRTKDDFLAMLGHELRTPLSAISSAVRVLQLTDCQGERAIRAHEVIARQVTHVKQLVNDLLDVERVVSGKIRLNRQPVDLAEAVRHAVATFTAETSLDRQIDISTEPAWVDVDAMRLQQVLTNIVANAIKYTPPGGRIRVALRADGCDAVLSVEDTGFGISPRLLPFIFDMYMQADRTLHRAQGGLGIGLTLVRRLVELHGGTIAVKSEGEGHGSTFTVRLSQISQERKGVAVAIQPERRRARPKRVLLIEDSEDAREMLRVMLELAGHVVYDAADGIRGLELLNVVRPDAAIIDIGLPGIDGYQVAKRIREESHGRDMLLLALTGYDSPGDAKLSSDHGFDHHLVKPVDPDQLARLLADSHLPLGPSPQRDAALE